MSYYLDPIHHSIVPTASTTAPKAPSVKPSATPTYYVQSEYPTCTASIVPYTSLSVPKSPSFKPPNLLVILLCSYTSPPASNVINRFTKKLIIDGVAEVAGLWEEKLYDEEERDDFPNLSDKGVMGCPLPQPHLQGNMTKAFLAI